MEAHTYGGSKAAEILVELLEINPIDARYVGRYWADFSRTMNEIENAEGMEYKTKIHLSELFYKDTVDFLNRNNLQINVRTYLKNIMVTRCKQLKLSLANTKKDHRYNYTVTD